jgi:hypothetical protein
MRAATLVRPVLTGPPNDLPWKPYVYNGSGIDTLTAFMDDEPDEEITRTEDRLPCGTERAYARHRRRGEPIDAACRAADTRATLDRKRRRREKYADAVAAGLGAQQAQRARDRGLRCGDCGYLFTAAGHKTACGGAA